MYEGPNQGCSIEGIKQFLETFLQVVNKNYIYYIIILCKLNARCKELKMFFN